MPGLFEFSALLDQFSSSLDFLDDIIDDPTLLQSSSWTFIIPTGPALKRGWSVAAIARLLSRYGVKTWDRQNRDGEYLFKVKQEQVQWVEYLLLKHGIPLSRNFSETPRPQPKRKPKKSSRCKRKKSGGFLSSLDDFLDETF